MRFKIRHETDPFNLKMRRRSDYSFTVGEYDCEVIHRVRCSLIIVSKAGEEVMRFEDDMPFLDPLYVKIPVPVSEDTGPGNFLTYRFSRYAFVPNFRMPRPFYTLAVDVMREYSRIESERTWLGRFMLARGWRAQAEREAIKKHFSV
jgi:hypothetical protein